MLTTGNGWVLIVAFAASRCEQLGSLRAKFANHFRPEVLPASINGILFPDLISLSKPQIARIPP
jgi:hypothetical protein